MHVTLKAVNDELAKRGYTAMLPAANEKGGRYDLLALIGKVPLPRFTKPATGGKNMIDAKPNVDHF